MLNSLSNSAFVDYQVPTLTSIGVSIYALSTFLKQATKNDQLTILCSDADAKECLFVLEDGQRASVFNLKLKMIQDERLMVRNIENYSAELVISSNAFLRALRDIKVSRISSI